MAGNTPESLYPYKPSKVAGIAAVIIFTTLLIVYILKLFKTRTWFCIPLLIGAAFEVLGFAARAKGHDEPGALNPFIIQTFLILLAPILIAATVYMFLGRIIRSTGYDALSIIRPTLLTKVFVGGDILCFLIQAAGAGILSKAETMTALDLGKNTILGGLILQLLIFGFFIVVAVIFHRRMWRLAKGKRDTGRGVFDWHKFLFTLYTASIIITFRNIFRVAEYVGGEEGYLLQKEWPIYAFDAAPMAIVLTICITWYVGDIVSQSRRSQDEEAYSMVPDPWNRR